MNLLMRADGAPSIATLELQRSGHLGSSLEDRPRARSR